MTNIHGINLPGLEDPEVAAHVVRLLDEEIARDAEEAAANQLAIAQAYEAAPNRRAIDGLGPQVLAMDQTAFLHLKCQERFDFGSKRDRKWLLQRYPEMKPAGRSTVRDTFGYTPGLDANPVLHTAFPRNVRQSVKLNQN